MVHSLHGYFLRPGDPHRPIVYEVDRTRDGRSFTTRRVPRCSAARHLHDVRLVPGPEEGSTTRQRCPRPPAPEASPTRRPPVPPPEPAYRRPAGRHLPLDVRYVDHAPGDLAGARRPATASGCAPTARRRRTDGRLLHACALTYASDLTLLDAALLPHVEGGWRRARSDMAILDHAMWFHRPFRADDWLLYVQDSPNAGGGRGLATGRLYSAEGTLVASVVQEGLIRRRRQ